MLRDVPSLLISDSNFTSNGRLPKQQQPAAAAAEDGEAAGPGHSEWGGALAVGWRDSDSTRRNVTLLNCRCAPSYTCVCSLSNALVFGTLSWSQAQFAVALSPGTLVVPGGV
jgi:hypothetical protein